MMAEILQIDPSKPNFDATTLTVVEASAKHNILGGKSFCRCRKDCILMLKCSCIALGKLCRDKCHSGSINLNNIYCSKCVTPRHGTHNVTPKQRNSGNTIMIKGRCTKTNKEKKEKLLH